MVVAFVQKYRPGRASPGSQGSGFAGECAPLAAWLSATNAPSPTKAIRAMVARITQHG